MSLAFVSGMPGPMEILLILFVILLLFGAKRLPELSRSLGKSLSEFKRGKEEGARDLVETLAGDDKDEAKDGDEAKKEEIST